MTKTERENALLDEWLKARHALELAKKAELLLRDKITPAILLGKTLGSATGMYGSHKMTATARLNFTIKADTLKLSEDRLTMVWDEQQELWDNLPPEELEAIDWKPNLKEGVYKKLPADAKLRSVVVVKPGQASLELKA
jgi:hypothetical protein